MRVKKGKIKRRRHKKYLKEAKGYSHAKSHRFRVAKNQVEKSMQYATRDRKNRKRVMRRQWISSINSACKQRGIKYSRFIAALKKAEVALDRRMLSRIAVEDPQAFDKLTDLYEKNS